MRTVRDVCISGCGNAFRMASSQHVPTCVSTCAAAAMHATGTTRCRRCQAKSLLLARACTQPPRPHDGRTLINHQPAGSCMGS